MGIDGAQTVAELVVERPARARVFERLGIDYCCGGKRSLADACSKRRLDVARTVAELALVGGETDAEERSWADASLAELCEHIVSVHHAFLREELPRLEGLLAKVARAHGAELPTAHETLALFTELREEIDEHLEAEEQELFPLLALRDSDRAQLEEVLPRFEDDHSFLGDVLEQLRELNGGYDLADARCNTHRATLDGLRELELDLHEHIHEENNILFPRALAAATR